VRGNPTGLTDPSGLEGFSDLVVTGYPPGRDPSALAAQAEALAQGQAQARAQMQQGSDAAATASAAAGNQVQADMQLQMASRGALDAHRSDGSGFMAGLQRAIATIGGGGDIALRPGPGPLPLMIPRESVDSFDKGQVVAAAPTIGVVLGFFTAEAGLLGVIGLGGTGAIGLAAGGDGIVATSAAEGAVISQEAQAIAGGHAFVKHVVERRDFPGIRTPAEFAQVIQEIMDNPQMVRFLDSGRDAYYRNGVVVITMPGYDGTAFPPKLTPGEVAAGFDFFMTKLH